jgi:azurin
MNSRIAFLAAACTLALAACGKPPSPAETTANPPAPAEEPAPVAAPAETPAAAPVPVATDSDKPAAVVADCATVIEGNDAMQFNVGSIAIPASCTEFKITLNHTGTMPIAAMGHNVVITTMADMKAVAADGMGAGAGANYIKPDDARVIAHTKVIGGGESTSVSFPVSKLQGSGPYEFFCSFPGHSAIMKGTIAVQ